MFLRAFDLAYFFSSVHVTTSSSIIPFVSLERGGVVYSCISNSLGSVDVFFWFLEFCWAQVSFCFVLVVGRHYPELYLR